MQCHEVSTVTRSVRSLIGTNAYCDALTRRYRVTILTSFHCVDHDEPGTRLRISVIKKDELMRAITENIYSDFLISLRCLALLSLMVSSSLLVHAQTAARVWEGPLNIPTYEL